MDKNRVKGVVKQATGSVKEAWGKLTGNIETEVEGKAEKIEGKIQSDVGVVKDKVRE